ncbi:hypothetical protein HOC99_00180 [Candidatus Woesearchaeota archaeon]|jgi:hypothetical protein|nr:hypothetical protein [Candidatus Woesearchaeota archaeon]MBT4387988.1 hypothetical protein [Candidatus Woesearchaeota archaeon]MBT4595332.1 hypothetical protein [Candidatus Woesearchaeota archaeon]MBT5741263.1 hypothetical protein [Candidatus Woesearchaeota archaeon]MBT7296556.1 hypothetical protein [Candidatus Woesearchaeota archaeon]
MVNKNLIDYIKKIKLKGYSDIQIRSFLLKYGYKLKVINEALNDKSTNPAIPNIVNETNTNHSSKYINGNTIKSNNINTKANINSKTNLPILIKMSGIFNYILGITILVFGSFFYNLIFDLSGILKYLFISFSIIISILFFVSGYYILKLKTNSKIISSIPNFILILFCIIMIYKETYGTNLFGMLYYFIILIFPLLIVYVLFDKKFTKYFT